MSQNTEVKRMFACVVSGRVIPERTWVTLEPAPYPFGIVWDKQRFNALVVVSKAQVVVSLLSENPITIDNTLRNRVATFVRMLIDTYGYVEGHGLDFEITSIIDPDNGKHMVPSVQIDSLHRSKSERESNFDTLFRLLFSDGLTQSQQTQCRRALADLREAILSPNDTGLYCYRAVESIRQFYLDPKDGDDDSHSWKRMRDSLRIARPWLDEMKKNYRNPLAHGKEVEMSGEEREQAMQRVWKVMDRFFVSALKDFQPLDESRYKLID